MTGSVSQSVHPDGLKGYHMLLAIGEVAINRSLANMFHFFKERDHRRHYQIQLQDQDFSAIMDPPQVRLNGAGNNHSLWFYLNLAAVKYRGISIKEGGQLVKWSFAYKVNLRAESMSKTQIEKHAGLAPGVRETLSQRAREQGALVRHLVLDFEHSPTQTFNADRSSHPGLDAETLAGLGLHKAFAEYFASMRGYENPYSLAIFVEDHRQKPQGPQPTFIPGNSLFSIFEDDSAPDRSTVNLLMMNRGESLPANAEEAANLDKNWHTNSTADGRFVVSWRLFLEKWLFPQLSEIFGFTSWGHYETWEFHGVYATKSESWRGLDRYAMDHTRTVKGFLDTETKADDSHFSVGVIKLHGYWDHLVNVVRKALGGGAWETNRYLGYNAMIEVIAGENGHLSFVPHLNRDKHISGRGVQIDATWQNLFAHIAGILDEMPEYADKAMAQTMEIFEKAKTNLAKQLSDSFLLPAGERLFFKNAGFDESRNLVFDISLKAVN
jgi:hypothetical protein